jgi:hypothetical protein
VLQIINKQGVKIMTIWNIAKKLFSLNHFLNQVDYAQESLNRQNEYFTRLEEDYIKICKENKELKAMVRDNYLDLMFSEVLFNKRKS